MVSPIFSVGKSAKQIEISIAVKMNSHDFANLWLSKVPSGFKNFRRFKLAKLHDELSRCMYSEHGLDAVMRPDSGVVCQSLMMSSYWIPGSAQAQAASANLSQSSRASTSSITSPLVLARRPNLVPCSTASMNSSFTRTELFAFWY